jgi:hypothetical protein
MDICLNIEYKTGLLANTDLHAGGLLFCIVYETVIKFLDEVSVEMYYNVIDPISPMDNSDVLTLQRYYQRGTYSYNQRGYLQCLFDNENIELVGRFGYENKTIVFHAFNKHQKRSWSIVVKRND